MYNGKKVKEFRISNGNVYDLSVYRDPDDNSGIIVDNNTVYEGNFEFKRSASFRAATGLFLHEKNFGIDVCLFPTFLDEYVKRAVHGNLKSRFRFGYRGTAFGIFLVQ